MKRILYIIPILLSGLVSCNYWDGHSLPQDTDSVEVTFSDSGTVVFGYAGMDCNDTLLDLIVPGRNPALYNILELKERGKITGSFATGDRIAVELSSDRKKVTNAIDLSSLIGTWNGEKEENDSNAVSFMLAQDGTATALYRPEDNLVMKKWDIRGGKLVITKSGWGKMERKQYYDTLEICNITQDTMTVCKNSGSRYTRLKFIKARTSGK